MTTDHQLLIERNDVKICRSAAPHFTRSPSRPQAKAKFNVKEPASKWPALIQIFLKWGEKTWFNNLVSAAKGRLYAMALSFCLLVCLFVCSSVAWNVWCCWCRASRTTSVSSLVKTLPPRKIYASGGGLLVSTPITRHTCSAVILLCKQVRVLNSCIFHDHGTGPDLSCFSIYF